MRKDNSFLTIVNDNWKSITIGIIASICFQILSGNNSLNQKILFVIIAATILNLAVSSFQWAMKQNKNILLILLTLIWLILIFLLTLILPLIVELTI